MSRKSWAQTFCFICVSLNILLIMLHYERSIMLEMTESEFANGVKYINFWISSWYKKWLLFDKQVLLPPNEIQFLMGYCDLLIKPDLIRSFSHAHYHRCQMASVTFSVCFIVSSFFFKWFVCKFQEFCLSIVWTCLIVYLSFGNLKNVHILD